MYRITWPLAGLSDRALCAEQLGELLEGLCAANLLRLKLQPGVPSLADALAKGLIKPTTDAVAAADVGAAFSEERWQDISSALKAKHATSRDMACWRVAELRAKGVMASPEVLFQPGSPNTYEVAVRLPDGTLEGSPVRDVVRVRNGHRVQILLNLFTQDSSRRLSESTLQALLNTLTRIDIRYLRKYPQTPKLRESKVRYQEEPPGNEDWQDVATCLFMGIGDCEDFSCWLAAELQLQGIDAVAFAKGFKKKDGDYLYHIMVALPNGQVLDPSRSQGMR